MLTFTGKERDSETGFSYYSARYYDPEVSALFLSVDPCADKYPGISPYAYCAWNPVKYVDPNGDTITMHFLNNENDNKTLLKSLSSKTGLSLYLENGIVKYTKDNNGQPIVNYGSESARNDLMACIDDNTFNYVVEIGVFGESVDGGKSNTRTSEDTKTTVYLDIKDFSENDHPTFDIGMVFMHELQHGYYGLRDDGIKTTHDCGSKYGEYYGGTVGSAVNRVNEYRKELNLPIRDAYEANPYRGCYFQKIPFKNNKTTLWL